MTVKFSKQQEELLGFSNLPVFHYSLPTLPTGSYRVDTNID